MPVLLTWGVCLATAVCAAGAPPAAPARVPASQPAQPPPPAVPRGRILDLVAQLTCDRYQLRQAAREELTRVVNLPGVAEILKARLKTAPDPETRASLERILEGFDQPLAMIWYRGGLNRLYFPARAPWLFIAADGSFVFNATSFYFTGSTSDPLAGDYRQGKLTPRQLYDVKEMIGASGLAGRDRLETARISGTKTVQVSFYVRSGRDQSAGITHWDPKQLHPDSKDAPSMQSELGLAHALRKFVAARDSRPYAGPMAVHVMHAPMALRGKGRERIKQLPEWPLAKLNIHTNEAMRGGIPLTGEQLKLARALLSKSDLYRYSNDVGYQVLLAPFLKEAVEIYNGSGR